MCVSQFEDLPKANIRVEPVYTEEHSTQNMFTWTGRLEHWGKEHLYASSLHLNCLFLQYGG